MKNKILAIIIIIIFIFSIIPLLYIAKYNHSCADDYTYGLLTSHEWKDSGSIIQVLKAGIETTSQYYEKWQGTFSAMFIMSIQPSVFSEGMYGITTWILLLTFILANIFLSKIILIDYIKTDKYKFVILTLLLILISIQFVPSPVQAFYWYNGAMYYTFFYSLMLILIGCILKLLKSEKKSQMVKYVMASIVLAIAIGGSNFITALVTNIILFAFVIYSFITKNKNWRFLLIIFGLCLISLGISIIAPGNSVRQANTVRKYGAIASVLYSFKYAYSYFIQWLTIPNILFFTIVSPIIYNIAKNTKLSFKYPTVITIISVCIFSAQFTPTIYALNGLFVGRVQNILYFSFHWIIIVNMFYYFGWLLKQNSRDKKIWLTITIIALLFIVVLELALNNIKTPITIEAINSISSGEAKQYDQEVKERLEIYNNDEIEDVKFKNFTVKPRLLFFSDITKNPNDWQNEAARDYYKKKSVVIVE